MSVASRFVGAHRHWRETGLGVSSQAEEHTDPRRGEKGQVGEEVLPLWAVPTHVSPPAPSDVPSARWPSSLPCSLLSQTRKCRLRGEGSPLQPEAPGSWGCSHLPWRNQPSPSPQEALAPAFPSQAPLLFASDAPAARPLLREAKGRMGTSMAGNSGQSQPDLGLRPSSTTDQHPHPILTCTHRRPSS